MADSRNHSRRAAWSSRDVLRVAGVVALVYLALRFFWLTHVVLLMTFLGVLFGLALAAGADRLAALRIPRGLGVLLIVLAVFGAFGGAGALAAPALTGQLSELRTQLPAALDRAQDWISARQSGLLDAVGEGTGAVPPDSATAGAPAPAPAPAGGDTAAAPRGGDDGFSVRRGLAQQIRNAAGNFFAFLSSTLSVLAGLLLVLFVAIYFAVEPETYLRGALHLIPHRDRARAREVLHNTGIMLRRWLVTQLIGMVIIGIITSVVLMLLDVKAALALGLIAGLLEFIPYIGPILSAVPAIAMGFLDGPEKALWVALAYTGIQQAESQVIMPLLLREGLELPPVLTLVTQAVMGIIFGFPGLLVAVPLLGAVLVPVKMLYVQDVVGDDVAIPEDST